MPLDTEAFASLYRHWMWGNIIKIEFERHLTTGLKDDPMGVDRPAAFMAIWYGMLYGDIEELRNAGEMVPNLDLNDPFWDEHLRLFRNAVFHPQKQYWTPKFLKLLQHPDAVKKIREAHEAISNFFLSEASKRFKTAP